MFKRRCSSKPKPSPSAAAATAAATASSPLQALDALEEDVTAAWLKLPLTFRRAMFLSAPAEGFGVYTRRDNAVFDTKTPLLIYAEPVGYGWKANGELNEINLTLDVILKTPAGETVFEKKDFQTIKLSSHSKNRELFLNISLSLTGAPAGKYVATVGVHDNSANKVGSFDLPFELKE